MRRSRVLGSIAGPKGFLPSPGGANRPLVRQGTSGRPRYATVGRTSIYPVVFFRLQLVMFFEGIRSKRQLVEIASDRLSVRWHLGYDLHEPLPEHSSLTRIFCERYGLEIFRGFFEKIVQMCFEAGLVRGEELFFDSTKVKADADIDSLASRFLVETHLNGLFEGSSISEGNEAEPSAGTDFDALATCQEEALIANKCRKERLDLPGGQAGPLLQLCSAQEEDLRLEG